MLRPAAGNFAFAGSVVGTNLPAVSMLAGSAAQPAAEMLRWLEGWIDVNAKPTPLASPLPRTPVGAGCSALPPSLRS